MLQMSPNMEAGDATLKADFAQFKAETLADMVAMRQDFKGGGVSLGSQTFMGADDCTSFA